MAAGSASTVEETESMNSAFAHPIGGSKLGWPEEQPEASAVAAANENPSPNLNAFTASRDLFRVPWSISA
jgi:hypothetical protein